MKKGFTLIELLIVIGVVSLLVTLTTITLLKPQRHVAVEGIIEQILADLKSQQTKAMLRDNNGSSFGIHFSTSAYTLFNGSSYSASSSSNYVVNVDNNLSINSTFVGNNLVFDPITGETATGSVVLTDTTDNSQKTLHINSYGVVDNVN